MKLEEAKGLIGSTRPEGFRVAFYRDGKFELTPEESEPPIKSHREAYRLAKDLAASNMPLEDVTVLNNRTMQQSDRAIVMNPKRLNN